MKLWMNSLAGGTNLLPRFQMSCVVSASYKEVRRNDGIFPVNNLSTSLQASEILDDFKFKFGLLDTQLASSTHCTAKQLRLHSGAWSPDQGRAGGRTARAARAATGWAAARPSGSRACGQLCQLKRRVTVTSHRSARGPEILSWKRMRWFRVRARDTGTHALSRTLNHDPTRLGLGGLTAASHWAASMCPTSEIVVGWPGQGITWLGTDPSLFQCSSRLEVSVTYRKCRNSLSNSPYPLGRARGRGLI